MRGRRWYAAAAASFAVVIAVPAGAFAAARDVTLPAWMADMMGHAPRQMQQRMQTPQMQEMMRSPAMQSMLGRSSPPPGMTQMVGEPAMQQMMQTPQMDQMMGGGS